MYLVFGHNGYIGTEFKRQLGELAILAPTHKECWSYSNLINLMKTTKPRFIINAAGYTGKPNVDSCEINQADCYNGNITYPIDIVTAANELSIPFCHVSSGCIYNGYDKIFTELDKPNFSFEYNNCSYYSGTKALCERILMENFPNVYIWRLRIPFEETANSRNYITKLLTYNKILNFSNSLSNKEEFVRLSLETIKKSVPCGIYNIVNEGSMRAEDVFYEFQKQGIYIKKEFYNSLEEFNKDIKAPRSNCVLSVDKLRSVGIHPRHINEVMAETVKKYKY